MMLAISLHRSTIVLVITITQILVGIGAESRLRGQSSEAAEKKTVRTFAENYFAEYEKKDFKTLEAMWSQKSPEVAAQLRELARLLATYELSLKNLQISKIALAGEPAARVTMQVSADLTAVDLKSKSSQREKMVRSLELVKENGTWKLWHHASAFDDLAKALIAVQSTEKQKDILTANKDLSDDIKETTDSLISLGVSYYRIGDYRKASFAYQTALSMLRTREKKGYELDLARALINIGATYSQQGNNFQALKVTKEAVEIIERLDDPFLGIGHASLVMGLIEEANRDYSAALKSYGRAYDNFGKAKEPRGQATARKNMGVVSVALREFAQAEQFYREALKLAEESMHDEEIVRVSSNLGLLRHVIAEQHSDAGKIESAKKEFEAALKVYRDFLPRSQKPGFQSIQVNILSDMAHTYLALGQAKEALEAAEQAANLADRIGFHSSVWQAKTLAGQAYRRLLQPSKAHLVLDSAIDTVEQLRYLVGGAETQRQLFFEDKLAPYHEKIALLMTEGKVPEAFAYAERAKARVLLDVLHLGIYNPATRMTAKDLAEEQALLARLRLQNRAVFIAQQALTVVSTKTPRDQSQIDAATDRLKKIELELNNTRQAHQVFEQKLYVTDPGLQLRRGGSPPFSLDDAGRLLTDESTALVEFVVVNNAIYVFVVTKDPDSKGKAVVTGTILSVNRKDLLTLIAGSDPEPGAQRMGGFRDQLATNDLKYSAAAKQLYEILLKPVREHLKAKTHLVIVPDDILWEIPFQALQSGPNHFLIEDYSISYSASFTVLREMRKLRDNQQALEKKSDGLSLLALGNPAFSKDAVDFAKFLRRAESLGNLDYAEKEVEALKRIYGADLSKVITGADAREEVVKADAGKYRVLHFATHGIFDSVNPMFSYLLLAQPEKKTEETSEDGYLEAWEVMKLDLKKTDLAVLAACQTGRGRIGSGEGVIGMSWAFFIGGCPTTVVSQWYVDDEASKDLMVAFHTNLTSAKMAASKSESLRLAQLSLMKRADKRYRHPYYWAGFVLVGDGR